MRSQSMTAMFLLFLFFAVFFDMTGTNECPPCEQMLFCKSQENSRERNITCEIVQVDQMLGSLSNVDKAVQQPVILRLNKIPLFHLKSEILLGMKLEFLRVQDCNLSSVDENAFADSSDSLKALDFSYNSFERVPSKAFEKLSSLRDLYLDNNRLTALHADSFKGLYSLRYLFLRRNRIQFIDESAFVGIGNEFQLLWLGQNELTAVPSQSLRNRGSLKSLDLQENKITALQSEEFAVMNSVNLTDLNLEKNRIGSLPPRAFLWLKKLEQLDLSRNKIEYIHPFAFQGIEDTLGYLQLKYNRLHEIPAASLKNLNRLSTIVFEGNNISKVRKDDFPPSLKKLRIIHLENNTLLSVDPMAFSSLDALEFLYLESNRLKSAPKETYGPLLDRLFLINIQDNPFHCDCEIAWLRDWMDGNKSSVIKSPKEIKCASPEEHFNMSLAEIPKDQLICRNLTSKPPLQNCDSKTVLASHSHRLSSIGAFILTLQISFMYFVVDVGRFRLF